MENLLGPFKRYLPAIWTFAWNWESSESVIYFYILIPKNLIEIDHNFVFFGYKVSIQQHFKSRLFWKTKTKCQGAENSRISGEPCIRFTYINCLFCLVKVWLKEAFLKLTEQTPPLEPLILQLLVVIHFTVHMTYPNGNEFNRNCL